jgi:hypothetical protein
MSNELAVSGVLVLPKINKIGVYIPETMILLHKVTGAQPCTIDYNGQKLAGMKIYTSEGNFKSPITMQELASATAQALSTGTCQTIASQSMKALPAPKKISSKVVKGW